MIFTVLKNMRKCSQLHASSHLKIIFMDCLFFGWRGVGICICTYRWKLNWDLRSFISQAVEVNEVQVVPIDWKNRCQPFCLVENVNIFHDCMNEQYETTKRLYGHENYGVVHIFVGPPKQELCMAVDVVISMHKELFWSHWCTSHAAFHHKSILLKLVSVMMKFNGQLDKPRCPLSLSHDIHRLYYPEFQIIRRVRTHICVRTQLLLIFERNKKNNIQH